MFPVATAESRALVPDIAAREIAETIEEQLGCSSKVGGALIFATAATGPVSCEIGRLLAERWPQAELVGSSFEGILTGGRSIRDEPAIGVMAFGGDPGGPVPLTLSKDSFTDSSDLSGIDAIEHALVDAAGGRKPGPDDLLLLFPDALSSAGLEDILAELGRQLGGLTIAGAAAAGLSGGSCVAWSGDAPEPGACMALFVPGGARSASGAASLQLAAASRFASPWLEISQSRSRWIDGLDDEPPIDWVRRQLGLDATDSVAPFLDRLLVRLRHAGTADHDRDTLDESAVDFIERYVVGFDDRRGSISIPGEFRQGGQLAFALPDAERARTALRSAIEGLRPSPALLQFSCRARDQALHGDADLESALVAHAASDRATLGTLGPFQLAPDAAGRCRVLVHTTVLTAFGES